MNWYLQNGNDSDVVISTKIEFVRNLKDFRFNLKNRNDIEKLKNKIKDNIYLIGYNLKYIELKDIDEITKESLVEKDILNYEYIRNNDSGEILVNNQENICIIINDVEHLKIQVFCEGLELESTLNLAIEIEEKIGEFFEYAINKKYGYLTSSPMNCGTGLKASVKLHLPALKQTNNINNLINNINNFGLNIKKVKQENNNDEWDILEISNKTTLGITENEIIENINIIIKKLIEQERQARKYLAKEKMNLEDMIYRSYGILINCRKISLEECQRLISNIKLGTDLGILKEINDIKIKKLYLYTKNANMQKYFGEKFETLQLDIKRAEIIKLIINEK